MAKSWRSETGFIDCFYCYEQIESAQLFCYTSPLNDFVIAARLRQGAVDSSYLKLLQAHNLCTTLSDSQADRHRKTQFTSVSVRACQSWIKTATKRLTRVHYYDSHLNIRLIFLICFTFLAFGRWIANRNRILIAIKSKERIRWFGTAAHI